MNEDSEQQQQIDDLKGQVAVNRADLDALLAGADVALGRADASEARADAAEQRADASETRADTHDARLDQLETRVDVDEEILAELQSEGLLGRERAAHLETALRSSRKIGAAMGIIMAGRAVSEEEAFLILRQTSQHTNVKLRELAESVVLTGDISDLAASPNI